MHLADVRTFQNATVALMGMTLLIALLQSPS